MVVAGPRHRCRGRQRSAAVLRHADAPAPLPARSEPSAGSSTRTRSHAVCWAQAERELPCFGTTHADHFYGAVPVTRRMREEEIRDDYELQHGRRDRGALPEGRHRPRPTCRACWSPGTARSPGARTSPKAVENAIVLEAVARMALHTLLLNARGACRRPGAARQALLAQARPRGLLRPGASGGSHHDAGCGRFCRSLAPSPRSTSSYANDADRLGHHRHLLLAIVGDRLVVRPQNLDTSTDYFLAGRDVGWFAVGASVFASNIGSEHIVGLAGSGAHNGMAQAHWELHAWVLMLLAWVFVPFYYRSGVFTMPEFLEKRLRRPQPLGALHRLPRGVRLHEGLRHGLRGRARLPHAAARTLSARRTTPSGSAPSRPLS